MNTELLAGNIAAHWVQSGLLAGALLVALRVLRVRDPRLRLAVLHLGFVAIVLLPMMQPWRSDAVPLPALVEAETIETTEIAAVPSQAAGSARPLAGWHLPTQAFVFVVAAGIAIRLLWMLYGLLQLVRFSRTSEEVSAPAVAEELETQMGIAPRYVRQTDGRGPWTFGVLRSTVALPARFDALDPGFQRAVICHELHHVKRRDVVIAFAEELATAMLWFHPWVWLLCARIRVTREQVVDAGVVALLSNRDEYVRCLVNMSGHDLAPHLSQASAGMLRPRELRARVDAMFQEVQMSRTRFVAAFIALVAVLGVTGWVAVSAMPLRAASPPVVDPPYVDRPYVVSGFLTTAASAKVVSRTSRAQSQIAPPAAPRRQVKTSYAEYPQEALEKGIGGTVLVDIAVNATGDVTTAAVVSGPLELRASAFKAALGLKYEPGTGTTAMRVSVEYRLTADSWGVRVGDASAGSRGGTALTQAQETAGPDASGAYRIGGNLRAPRKIRDVAPQYPAAARDANVQGVVILEARVDEIGNVSDTRVLRSIPLLDQAAVDAVKQWKYEPTLMNGHAVPVTMTVTVNFTSRDTIHLQVTLPDGSTSALRLTSGVTGKIDAPGLGDIRLTATRAATGEVALSIHDGANQAHLGDLVLLPGDAVVQSPTTPSFGVKLRSWSQ